MLRVLGCFWVFLFLLHTAAAAPAEPCSFLQASYQSLDHPKRWLSSDDDGTVVLKQGYEPAYRFKFVESGRILEPTYDVPYGDSVHLAFFDERLIALVNPSSSSPAPAYVYLSAYPDIYGMFELKYCQHVSSTIQRFVQNNRPKVAVSGCPFYRATYTNNEDPSLTMRSEKDQEFFADLKVVIKGDRTPERPYTFGFTNGSGITFIQTSDDGRDESSHYVFLNESLRFDGIGSAADPAPAYFFMTGMAKVPVSMFRLTECKPD